MTPKRTNPRITFSQFTALEKDRDYWKGKVDAANAWAQKEVAKSQDTLDRAKADFNVIFRRLGDRADERAREVDTLNARIRELEQALAEARAANVAAPPKPPKRKPRPKPKAKPKPKKRKPGKKR